MLSTDALTSWETAKTMLGFADDQQSVVEFLINAVSATANRISGRRLKARDYDLRLNGTDKNSIVLPEYPIVSLSKVYIDGNREFPPESEIDPDMVSIDPDGGIIRLHDMIFPAGIGNVRVIAKLGYDPVPQDLELAVLEAISYNRRRLESGTTGMRQVSVDGTVTSQYELGLPLSIREVFEGYRSNL